MSDSSYLGQSPIFGDFPHQVIPATGVANYTMNFKVSGTNGVLVFINGAIQRPGVDFTASGTQLLFTDVVANGAQIFVYGMGLPKSSLAPSMGSVGNAELEAGLKATSAEVKALSSADKLVTPASLVGLPFSKEYVSAELEIIAGALITLPHGLGVVPKLVDAVLVCKVANAAYVPGDIVNVTLDNQGTNSLTWGTSCVRDSTNILIRPSGTAGSFILLDKSTTQAFQITNTSWRLVVRAFA